MAARAQQPMPIVGFVHSQVLNSRSALVVAAFRRGLAEVGYVEGQNVAIEYRWAEDRSDRAAALVIDLIGRRVDVIFANGIEPIQAAKAATTTIPIVFAAGVDPVKFGLVPSLSNPDGNVTGVSFAGPEVDAKRLGLLRDLVPKAGKMAALINPDTPFAEDQTRSLQAAARAIGRQIVILNARNQGEFDATFASLARDGVDALLITPNSLFANLCFQLSAMALRHGIPSISEWRECAAAGGLISYGTDSAESVRQAGNYVGRILKGAKPTELPVLLPTKFEMVINLKTAKALGLDVPLHLQQIADEVIE